MILHDKKKKKALFKEGVITGLVFTIIGAIVLALLKEYRDKKLGQPFDWQDLIMTTLGGIVGQLVQALLFILYLGLF